MGSISVLFTNQAVMRKDLGWAGIRTPGCWVGSKNATSVLRSRPSGIQTWKQWKQSWPSLPQYHSRKLLHFFPARWYSFRNAVPETETSTISRYYWGAPNWGKHTRPLPSGFFHSYDSTIGCYFWGQIFKGASCRGTSSWLTHPRYTAICHSYRSSAQCFPLSRSQTRENHSSSIDCKTGLRQEINFPSMSFLTSLALGSPSSKLNLVVRPVSWGLSKFKQVNRLYR